jgi:hypothetical protein
VASTDAGLNIYEHLFAWDRAAVLDAMNQAVSRLYAYELPGKDPSQSVHKDRWP